MISEIHCAWSCFKLGAPGRRLIRHLKDEDPEAYRNILRISNERFDMLLGLIDKITREKDTKSK